jgi:hypothetical protein
MNITKMLEVQKLQKTFRCMCCHLDRPKSKMRLCWGVVSPSCKYCFSNCGAVCTNPERFEKMKSQLACWDCGVDLVAEDDEDFERSVYCQECYDKRTVNLED